ncbi:MAG: hypothetical protein HeimC3_26510 [Candidatus Heimdallarchaeota archaeon LC_3]|nr:MAG: hypothetical protein HeimC3_26510 [Candidatus Heimdallarchaeota archaeon LC_3]
MKISDIKTLWSSKWICIHMNKDSKSINLILITVCMLEQRFFQKIKMN